MIPCRYLIARSGRISCATTVTASAASVNPQARIAVRFIERFLG
jgi:hypothetical protein